MIGYSQVKKQGKSIQVMDERELEVLEDQSKGHPSRPSV